MNNIKIICNTIGFGKTTYALNMYKPNIYLNQDIIEHRLSDTIYTSDHNKSYCIIDSVDTISERFFSNALNHILSLSWKEIILIFDVKKSDLNETVNFNNMWKSGLLPRNFSCINYTADKNSFYEYFRSFYPDLKSDLYDHIIEMTEYNFNKIDRLMLINRLNSDRTDEIDPRAIAKYVEETVKANYKDIPDADILLQKASIIGEKFISSPLESPDGFGFETAVALLNQMNEMHLFIRSCINNDNDYEFVCHDLYKGVFNSISCDNKMAWTKILIKYYKTQYEHNTDIEICLSILNCLNSLYKYLTTKIYERKKICYLRLHYYQKLNDTYHVQQVLAEITESFSEIINTTELTYLRTIQAQNLMSIGEYNSALQILKIYYDSDNYLGSKMLIKYYYALCLYQTGNVDFSFEITQKLVEHLKYTSGSNSHPQQLYCMTYSLMATLQNHLGRDDKGIHYFNLALKNAKNKLTDPIYYNIILKKCDMFFLYDQAKNSLKRCLLYFEKNQMWSYAGEVSMNLATEMMFQDCENPKEIEQYFNKALSYFNGLKNEKLAYAWNNLGIYAVIVENVIQKGLNCFQNALLVGLSDFSYMTIYLNICMCYLLMGQFDTEAFENAYNRFVFAKKALNKRENETVYENMYNYILDILIDEFQGKEVAIRCEEIIESRKHVDFFTPLLSDILKRSHNIYDSVYTNNIFFYTKMNEYHCFFAEFRFWE